MGKLYLFLGEKRSKKIHQMRPNERNTMRNTSLSLMIPSAIPFYKETKSTGTLGFKVCT